MSPTASQSRPMRAAKPRASVTRWQRAIAAHAAAFRSVYCPLSSGSFNTAAIQAARRPLSRCVARRDIVPAPGANHCQQIDVQSFPARRGGRLRIALDGAQHAQSPVSAGGAFHPSVAMLSRHFGRRDRATAGYATRRRRRRSLPCTRSRCRVRASSLRRKVVIERAAQHQRTSFWQWRSGVGAAGELRADRVGRNPIFSQRFVADRAEANEHDLAGATPPPSNVERASGRANAAHETLRRIVPIFDLALLRKGQCRERLFREFEAPLRRSLFRR